MKALYFDCFSGISGDMTLGGLIDLGINVNLFKSELAKLNLSGYDVIIEKTSRYGISGTDVRVVIGHTCSGPRPVRNLENIKKIIDQSGLNWRVKDFSKKVFFEISQAEAKVHNKDINEVHFDEAGALDSIVDIAGTAICIELLGVQRVFSSPLHDGSGFIKCEHGILSVPVPAVMEMLTGSKIPLINEGITAELVTPIGMGIIKCLASDFGNMPAMIVDKIGYGIGKRDTGRLDALKIVMGTLLGGDEALEEISFLEANAEDMSPEVLSFMSEDF